MARFFVDPDNIKKRQAVITGPDVKHIQKVLRLGEGDAVTLLDGRGNQYQANITGYNRDAVFCSIVSKDAAVGEPPVKVTLVQGLPKGDKMELVIQKGTELGVTRFIPLKCIRSVVKLDEKKAVERQKRWQRVALEAAKQCRRPLVPKVSVPLKWQEVIDEIPEDALLIIPWEGETAASVKDVLANREYNNIYIVVGPEGGFEPSEIDNAKMCGAKTVTLGPRILRTETAGLALISILMYLYGDIG